MKRLTIRYTDFWDYFEPENFLFTELLSHHFDVTILPDDSPEASDLLFFSGFGERHLDYFDSVKVFYTGENIVPDFNLCDYGIGVAYLDFGERYLRFPLYPTYDCYPPMLQGSFFESPAGGPLERRPFCSLVISNYQKRDPLLFRFEEELAQYKPIAYGGQYRNNVGGAVEDKIDFIARYKFNIAFENSEGEGYTTEKIMEALYARTVPIYWGNQLIGKEVNPATFINVHDFDTLDRCIDYIKRVDSDDRLYRSFLTESPRLDDRLIPRLDEYLYRIASAPRRFRPDYGRTLDYNRMAQCKARMFRNRLLRKLYTPGKP